MKVVRNLLLFAAALISVAWALFAVQILIEGYLISSLFMTGVGIGLLTLLFKIIWEDLKY